MADDEPTETTGDSGTDGDGRPKPEFEGQEILAGEGDVDDSSTERDE
ncbi:hypothetical protein NGM10_10930 [Halorussus salilacus]|nr:hypothetical protein [Halorussus salilacus]USZ67243.1 hypothetical protein NGM10_10930 [Halorussus salilacus]